MALRHPGKNAPVDDAAMAHLKRLGTAVDVTTAPRRDPDKIRLVLVRPYTFEELAWALQFQRGPQLWELLDLPWDERLAAALAKVSERNRLLVVVLLAASGQLDEARALWEVLLRTEENAISNGWAAFAVGDFEPPEHRETGEGRLSAMARIARFRPIAEKLALAAPALLTNLPRFFGRTYADCYTAIWTPVLEAFALTSERDESVIDQGYAEQLARLSSIKVLRAFGHTYEDKKAGLRTLFWLAMHQGRLLSAHRIAMKMGETTPWDRDAHRTLVAVEYVKAGDLGGAYEIARKWHNCEALAQAVQDCGY